MVLGLPDNDANGRVLPVHVWDDAWCRAGTNACHGNDRAEFCFNDLYRVAEKQTLWIGNGGKGVSVHAIAYLGD